MHLKFREIGTSLGTRSLGRTIRSKIESSINSNQRVTFDFKDVNLVSHAFADECFGKLLLNSNIEKVKSLTTFKNTNEPVKQMILFAFSQRLTKQNNTSIVK